jgi:hypothetical protein
MHINEWIHFFDDSILANSALAWKQIDIFWLNAK